MMSAAKNDIILPFPYIVRLSMDSYRDKTHYSAESLSMSSVERKKMVEFI